MDGQRGRSPSAGRLDIRHSPSPSPSPRAPFTSQAAALGSDPLLTDSAFSSQALPDQGAFAINQSYLTHAQQQQQQFPNTSDITSHTFLQAHSDNLANQYSAHGGPAQDLLDPNESFSSFDNQYFDPNTQSSSQDLESLYIDSSALDQSHLNVSATDSDNAFNMSTLQQRSPEAPHMMQQNSPYPSTSHAQVSPSTLGQEFIQRNSLDPNSAAEWYNYRGHRRAHSDAHSDVSSSAQVSPYLGNTEPYDALEQNSPLLNANNDPLLYNDSLGLGTFTLNDQQIQPAHISPGHSPRISPHLGAQHHVTNYNTMGNFGMLNSNGFGGQTQQDVYPPNFPGQESFPSMQHYGPNDLNQADQFSPPPEINIEFAPPPRQPSFEPTKDLDNNLVPPSRRGRRSTSDPPYMIPSSSRGNSPSPVGLHPSDSLSPRSQLRSLSRPNSPAGISKSHHMRRASVGAIPRNLAGEDILALAEQSNQSQIRDYPTPSGSPSSNASNAGDNTSGGVSKRAKHPANFQCTQCSKRFTRAYNLRSHLRTHTDERPYVCTVCGKAFARQHDRKRHEGLHSGEKKFVCQGPLAGGAGQWGCGRRFARADALGRHFKSEAGRSCIKPLLDEEARERQIDIQNQAMQDQLNAGPQGMRPVITPGPVDYTGMALPAALLQQYPVLGEMWDNLQQGNPAGSGNGVDDEDYSARSSFDASSGGEGLYDDEEPYTVDDNWSTAAISSQTGGYEQ